MRRLQTLVAIILIAALVAFLCPTTTALAAEAVDRSFEVYSFATRIDAHLPIGQGFIPTQSTLTSVDVALSEWAAYGAAGTITLNIRKGTITSPVLSTTSKLVAVNPDLWTNFALPSTLAITPGQWYIIELVPTAGVHGWKWGTAEIEGGIRILNGGTSYGNFDFRTYYSYTPPSAAITSSAVTKNVGDSTTITGTGFRASEAITVKFGTTQASITSGGTTGADGSVSVTVTVPALAKGTYNTVVTTTNDSTGATLSNGLTVTPKVTSTAVTKNVGDATTITGTGFSASEAITVKFGTTQASITSGGTTAADGSVSVTVTVPALARGTYNTVVTTTNDSTGATLSSGLTVTPKVTSAAVTRKVGESTTITGTGFKASEAITVKFGTTQATITGGGTTAANGGRYR